MALPSPSPISLKPGGNCCDDYTSQTVMAVSPEPNVLRQITRLLATFGYEVTTSRDLTLNSLQYPSPQFLIVDSESLDDQFRPLVGFREQHPAPYPYVLLFRSDSFKHEIIDAIDAGVDDFLEKPINNAEVLARLRAGARYLESRQERDDLHQTDQITGLMTEGAFFRVLKRQTEKSAATGCCVLMQLDHFRHINSAIGWTASKEILRAIAELFRDHCQNNFVPAKWQAGRFSALLLDTPLDQAREWAQTLCQAITECRSIPEMESLRLTASVGIGVWRPGSDTPNELLKRTEAALEYAIDGGGNCTIATADIEGGSDNWLDEQLFANAKAADIMTPSPLLLESIETIRKATQKLQHSNLDAAPVVDENDRLEGVVRARDLAASSSSSAVQNNPVRALMTDRVARVREEAPMPAVMQHFYDSPIDLVVVVRDEHPVGIIRQEDLAELLPPGGEVEEVPEPSPPSGGIDPDVTVSRESLLRDLRMSSVQGLNLGDNAQCR